ncbi:MAG TPA: hypothetical protein VFV23_08055 [Verrucomicrobiae bacterium]|nr:hypothetical protein [Verrucomicrobiae bacterium]
MIPLHKLNNLYRPAKLSRLRIVLALAVALAADGTQLVLGAFGWAGLDQLIDLVAMVLVSWLIGFHILLLPTFVTELVPPVEDLPTWTACAIAVIVLRRREERIEERKQPVNEKPPIDI